MECFNLEQVKTSFKEHKLKQYDTYYSKILKIYDPDVITLQFIIDKCRKDKTIIYTKNNSFGKVYFITKLLKNNYIYYKNFNNTKYDFTDYEENVLNSSNNNLITPKTSIPRYFNELPNTLLEKRKIDNDNIDYSKKLKIITDVNKNVSEKREPINISFKNSKIITNEKIKEIYNLEIDENEIYINDLLIGKMNNNGNLQLSNEIVEKYKKLEFVVNDEV
jgi:hypothetical protein